MTRAQAILAELDEAKAPDNAYRVAFSTGSKIPNKRGQTWRGRLVAWIERDIERGYMTRQSTQ